VSKQAAAKSKTNGIPAGMKFEPVNEHGILAVHADGEMFPFSAKDKAKLIDQINAAMKVVQFDFTPVTVGGKSAAFTSADQARVVRQVALHWLYFQSLNKLPMRIAKKDLTHPETWRMVRRIAEEKFGDRSAEAMAVAGKLVGMSGEAFQEWRERDDDFTDRF
jgi:hypothetical protein